MISRAPSTINSSEAASAIPTGRPGPVCGSVGSRVNRVALTEAEGVTAASLDSDSIGLLLCDGDVCGVVWLSVGLGEPLSVIAVFVGVGVSLVRTLLGLGEPLSVISVFVGVGAELDRVAGEPAQRTPKTEVVATGLCALPVRNTASNKPDGTCNPPVLTSAVMAYPLSSVGPKVSGPKDPDVDPWPTMVMVPVSPEAKFVPSTLN
jgi:hypothetical protein